MAVKDTLRKIGAAAGLAAVFTLTTPNLAHTPNLIKAKFGRTEYRSFCSQLEAFKKQAIVLVENARKDYVDGTISEQQYADELVQALGISRMNVEKTASEAIGRGVIEVECTKKEILDLITINTAERKKSLDMKRKINKLKEERKIVKEANEKIERITELYMRGLITSDPMARMVECIPKTMKEQLCVKALGRNSKKAAKLKKDAVLREYCKGIALEHVKTEAEQVYSRILPRQELERKIETFLPDKERIERAVKEQRRRNYSPQRAGQQFNQNQASKKLRRPVPRQRHLLHR